jgi:hypothetical protein
VTDPTSSVIVSAAGIARLTDVLTFADSSDAKIAFSLDLNGIASNIDPDVGSTSLVFEIGAFIPTVGFQPIYRLSIHEPEIGGDNVFEALWDIGLGNPDVINPAPSFSRTMAARSMSANGWGGETWTTPARFLCGASGGRELRCRR